MCVWICVVRQEDPVVVWQYVCKHVYTSSEDRIYTKRAAGKRVSTKQLCAHQCRLPPCVNCRHLSLAQLFQDKQITLESCALVSALCLPSVPNSSSCRCFICYFVIYIYICFLADFDVILNYFISYSSGTTFE